MSRYRLGNRLLRTNQIMKIKSRLIFLACFVFICSTAWSQDQVFSQFYAAPLQLNPALTGVTIAPRITLNYRNQWPGLPNAYSSYAAAFDQYISAAKSGFGLSVFSDQAGNGIYVTNRISGSYSYTLGVAENTYLRGGIEVAAVQKYLNWNKLLFLDQLDPIKGSTDEAGNTFASEEERPEQLSKIYPDFSAGLIAYSSIFYAGMTLKHVNAPNESFLDTDTDFGVVPVMYSIHAGAELNLANPYNNGRKPAFISPNILFAKQRNFQQLNIGAYASAWYLYGGAWFRHTFSNADAMIFLVGFQKGIIKVGYSYDMTVSGLRGKTGGAHEVSLVLNFEESERFKKNSKRKQYNDCLKMFK